VRGGVAGPEQRELVDDLPGGAGEEEPTGRQQARDQSGKAQHSRGYPRLAGRDGVTPLRSHEIKVSRRVGRCTRRPSVSSARIVGRTPAITAPSSAEMSLATAAQISPRLRSPSHALTPAAPSVSI